MKHESMKNMGGMTVSRKSKRRRPDGDLVYHLYLLAAAAYILLGLWIVL